MNALTKYARQYAAILLLLFFIVLLGIFTGGDVDQMQNTLNESLGDAVAAMATVLFFEIPFLGMPFIVLWLAGGAVYFTFRFSFINLRGFTHAIDVVRGSYDDPDDEGEVTHFQALSSALSATVGLGNIAGVAIAVSVGGPGAVFWMMAAAFFGMTSKFAECTLGQMYREVDEDGHVRGGPMVYLKTGLAEMGKTNLGKVLSVIFAVFCIGGSFGGGNMFQANQSFAAMSTLIPALGGVKAETGVQIYAQQPEELEFRRHLVRFKTDDDLIFYPAEDLKIAEEDWADFDGMYVVTVDGRAAEPGDKYNVEPGSLTAVQFASFDGGRTISSWDDKEGYKVRNPEKFRGGSGHLGWLYGIILAILVGIVIVGGIKRIGAVADKVVPLMCVLYVFSAVAILILHAAEVPDAIREIVGQAFSPDAVYGGALGVFITGIQRAAFSNEAGIGSAAIAHSAAKTKHPVREGLVALLEPFIDTIIICFMTGIVIVVTGAYSDPSTAGLSGVDLTFAAFEVGLSTSASLLLSGAVVLFAFSTMISWSYYGERCWSFLFGKDQTQPYRYIFCIFVWVGCVASLDNVVDFSDLMILSMAFPNILGVILLSGKVKEQLDEYWSNAKGDKGSRTQD